MHSLCATNMIAGKCKGIKYTGRSILFYHAWFSSTFKKCCVKERNCHMPVMVTPVQRKLFAIKIKSNITWSKTLRENFHNEFDVLIRICNVKYFLCHVARFYTCTIIVLPKKPSMKFTTVKPINILFSKK